MPGAERTHRDEGVDSDCKEITIWGGSWLEKDARFVTGTFDVFFHVRL